MPRLLSPKSIQQVVQVNKENREKVAGMDPAILMQLHRMKTLKVELEIQISANPSKALFIKIFNGDSATEVLNYV